MEGEDKKDEEEEKETWKDRSGSSYEGLWMSKVLHLIMVVIGSFWSLLKRT